MLFSYLTYILTLRTEAKYSSVTSVDSQCGLHGVKSQEMEFSIIFWFCKYLGACFQETTHTMSKRRLFLYVSLGIGTTFILCPTKVAGMSHLLLLSELCHFSTERNFLSCLVSCSALFWILLPSFYLVCDVQATHTIYPAPIKSLLLFSLISSVASV